MFREAFTNADAATAQSYAFNSVSFGATLNGEKIMRSAVLSWTEIPENTDIVASVLDGILEMKKPAIGASRAIQFPLDASAIGTLCERLTEFNAIDPTVLKKAVGRYEYHLGYLERGRNPRPAIAPV